MKTRIFSLLILSAFLLTGLVSAALDLSANSVPASATHGTDVVITFSLNNSDATNYSALTWAGSTTNIGTWKTLPSLTAINSGERRDLTAVIAVPKYSTGTINAVLSADTEGSDDTLPINIAISNSPAISLTKGTNVGENQTGSFNIVNSGNTVLNDVTFTIAGSLDVELSTTEIDDFTPGENITVNVVLAENATDFNFGSNSASVTARSDSTTSNAVSFTLEQTFCRNGASGSALKFKDIQIDTTGDDEDVWKNFDTITVEVEVENTDDADVDDIFIELGLFDSQGDNLIGDVDFINSEEEEFDIGNLNDGDEEVVTFEFKIPADFEAGDYKLAVKAYSDDAGEDTECTDRSSDLDNTIYQSVEVELEDDEGKFIAFDDIEFSPSEAVCGDTVTLEMDAYNVGDEDQDQVKILLKNTDLKIDLSREIRSDLEQGDNDRVEFTFLVPETARDGTYNLQLSAEYDYRNGVYRESSDESTVVPFKISRCSGSGNGSSSQVASITASLDSEAQAGKPLVVKATIRNTGSETASFAVAALGYESWADLESISDRLVTLRAGESKEVTITLNVLDDASAEESFIVEARAGDRATTREVAVNVASGSSKSFGDMFKGNTLIWVIGLVNVILIVLIIVVAVRLSQK